MGLKICTTTLCSNTFNNYTRYHLASCSAQCTGIRSVGARHLSVCPSVTASDLADLAQKQQRSINCKSRQVCRNMEQGKDKAGVTLLHLDPKLDFQAPSLEGSGGTFVVKLAMFFPCSAFSRSFFRLLPSLVLWSLGGHRYALQHPTEQRGRYHVLSLSESWAKHRLVLSCEHTPLQ